jgi:hypothetical protein
MHENDLKTLGGGSNSHIFVGNQDTLKLRFQSPYFSLLFMETDLCPQISQKSPLPAWGCGKAIVRGDLLGGKECL